MEKILFICKLTITYSDQDPIAERLDILQTQLIHFLDLWKPEYYYNPSVKNAYNQFGMMDKMPERVFHYFIDLYNRLEDKCGIVFFSTGYIKRRMAMGLRYNKCGYNEIHSRIGRKFFELERTAAHDVYAVCVANGVTDKGRISEVVKDSEEYEFDLRRVKKSIHRVKLQAAQTAKKQRLSTDKTVE